MAFLTIAGITLDVINSRANKPETIKIGTASRAFAGNKRSSVRAEKQVWEYSAAPLTPTALATLKTAIANGAFVSVGGILVGGPYTCEVRIVGEQQIPDASDVTTYKTVIDLHIEEV